MHTKGRPHVKHGLHPTQFQPQDHLARTLLERPDDAAPTIQQWMTVEDPDGQNIWIRKDGATRRSAPFAIETLE
eukprot:7262765-Prorocentrum_lima.AAC.1